MTEKKKSGAAMQILGAVLCVVFGFFLVCNIIIIVKGTLHPETPPTVLGVAPMVVLSGSMSGTAEDHIEVGDLIFTKQADIDELKVGDVVAFMDGSIIVTHRIVSISADRTEFVTKGDANNTEDEPISADQIIGQYSGRIPKVGDFALFLQKPLGMVIFIGVPVCAYETEAAFAADDKQNGSLLMMYESITCKVHEAFKNGETFRIGEVPVTVLHTPGHTAGGVSYITPDAVFTGDTLMGYSVGRCDLPTGNSAELRESLKKLAALLGNPDICGGHGPVTTLEDEKRRNPYL